MTTAEKIDQSTQSFNPTFETTDLATVGIEPTTPVESYRTTLRERMGDAYRGGGSYYLAVYTVRWLLDNALEFIDRHLVTIEQKKCLVAPWTISARRYTPDDNRTLWNQYDWTHRGEEWTKSPEWKERIIQELMVPNVPNGGTVVEIGPGGGRWTNELRQHCATLHVVDVSERALQLCRERFADCTNIDYQIAEGSTIDVADATQDAIWSYDVFVHIDPVTARGYFREFQRILKPGGRAVIHHAGPPLARLKRARRAAWRSELTDAMVAQFAQECGLKLVSQSSELVKREYDVVSILVKPA